MGRVSENPWSARRQAIEERIRPDFRRSVVLAVLAVVALVVGRELRLSATGVGAYRYAAYACALAVLVFGVLSTRLAAGEVVRVTARHAGATSTPLRLLVQGVGYLLTLLAVLTVLAVNLSQFLVGGAVTGIVLGIAAQQALGNFFAGMVLQLARPYRLGDFVRVHSGMVNGPHEGTVTDMSLIYTTLLTEQGNLVIPNSVLLTSAINPHAVPTPPEEAAPTPPDTPAG